MYQDAIELKGLSFQGRVGYYEFEREKGQTFSFDVRLELGYSLAGLNDDLAETVNYAEVADLIEAELAVAQDRLIESLTERLAEKLLASQARLTAVEISCHKPQAPLTQNFQDVVLKIRRERWNRVLLALGSNLGKREHYLAEALRSLERSPDFRQLRYSSIYESKPWGRTEQADFLNMVLSADCRLDPRALLRFAQSLEAAAGRIREEHWGARTLDVDLIDYGGRRIESPELTLPHPYADCRSFVYGPRQELEDGRIREFPDLRFWMRAEELLSTTAETYDKMEAESCSLGGQEGK